MTSNVDEQPNLINHSGPNKLPRHHRGCTQRDFQRKLEELKQLLESSSWEQSLALGIAWFSHDRIAVNTKRLGQTLGRKMTVIRENFRNANYKFQHMNRRLLAEFQQRFPEVTTKDASAWSWRILQPISDMPPVETMQVVNSADMLESTNMMSNTDDEESNFDDSWHDDPFDSWLFDEGGRSLI
jgi:hypothetical protein